MYNFPDGCIIDNILDFFWLDQEHKQDFQRCEASKVASHSIFCPSVELMGNGPPHDKIENKEIIILLIRETK